VSVSTPITAKTLLPDDMPAEEGLIGALLTSPDALLSLDGIRADDFAQPPRQAIFRAIRQLHTQGEIIDGVTVRAELTRQGTLQDAGGWRYLADLIERAPMLPDSAFTYARMVTEAARGRRAIKLAAEIQDLARRGVDWSGPVGELQILQPSPASPHADELLEVLTVAQIVQRVTRSGMPSWLIEGIWPGDAYGVLGAEDKAGKTWSVVDLGVSVVTGTPWLGQFPCGAPGPVLMYLGEGGDRPVLRRLDAAVRNLGGTLDDLDCLRIVLAAPRLTDHGHIVKVHRDVKSIRPRLVVLDPFYLSAAGAKGSDLYGMGEVLLGIQQACQDAGTALVVTTHWNKTGIGRGPERFTGVGPSAWGRVLGSAAVERRTVDPDGATTVQLRWEFRGSEIGDRTFRMRRRVWADDAKDLSSPLHYEVEVTDEGPEPGDGLSSSQQRVLAVLDPAPGLSRQEIGDRLADDGQGPPLKRATIQAALEELARLGLADADRPGAGVANRWWPRA
jgi:hypothetical protein